MNLSKKAATTISSSACVCWIFNFFSLQLNQQFKARLLKMQHREDVIVSHSIEEELVLHTYILCCPRYIFELVWGVGMTVEINTFASAGVCVGRCEWAAFLLAPSGCETSTDRPIRDWNHIDILCEHELMDFMFTCKHSPFHMWCWTWTLGFVCSGTGESVFLVHTQRYDTWNPRTASLWDYKCSRLDLLLSRVLVSSLSHECTIDLFFSYFQLLSFPLLLVNEWDIFTEPVPAPVSIPKDAFTDTDVLKSEKLEDLTRQNVIIALPVFDVIQGLMRVPVN